MIIVRYYPGEFPYFLLPAPADHICCYDFDTQMFDFLNSRLLSSDIVGVHCLCDVGSTSVYIVYRLRDELIRDLPPFDFYPEDELPF